MNFAREIIYFVVNIGVGFAFFLFLLSLGFSVFFLMGLVFFFECKRLKQ